MGWWHYRGLDQGVTQVPNNGGCGWANHHFCSWDFPRLYDGAVPLKLRDLSDFMPANTTLAYCNVIECNIFSVEPAPPLILMGDGFQRSARFCNDNDPNIHPGAAEARPMVMDDNMRPHR
jgi:hypothetical protein